MRIADRIPLYPSACSVEVLSVTLGYVKPPFENIRRNERGIRRMMRDLNRETLKNERIAERELNIQESTRERLRAMGYPEPREKTMTYLSILSEEGDE